MKLKNVLIAGSILMTSSGSAFAYDCKDAYQIIRTELTYLELEVDDCLARGNSCYFKQSTMNKFRKLGEIGNQCGYGNDRNGRTTARMIARIDKKMARSKQVKKVSASKKRAVSNRRSVNRTVKTLTTSK